MKTVLVLYHSQEHGNTHHMAVAVAQGAADAGAQTHLVNTNERRVDVEEFRQADAAAIGSPDYFSYIAGGLKVFLDDWYLAKNKNPEALSGKPIALFYSHGGGGRVKGPLEKLFASLGKQVGKTVESVGRPDKTVLAACRELGRQLAAAMANG